jgi:cysteine dioxygenase
MSQSSKDRLGLDDFILELAKAPAESITLERLADCGQRLTLSDELVSSHSRFRDDTYTRNLVCRTTRFELLVLCWQPGQRSTIHDHGGALNVTRVHSGTLTSRLFSVQPAQPAALVSEETLVRGGLTCVDRDQIHQLANESDRDLVTVHVYAPPLRDITVYSAESAESEQVRLRYTLADDFA